MTNEELIERLRGGKCPVCKGWGEVAYCGELVNCGCHGRYEAPISMEARDQAADAIERLTAQLAEARQAERAAVTELNACKDALAQVGGTFERDHHD